jgi:hypothetical protein
MLKLLSIDMNEKPTNETNFSSIGLNIVNWMCIVNRASANRRSNCQKTNVACTKVFCFIKLNLIRVHWMKLRRISLNNNVDCSVQNRNEFCEVVQIFLMHSLVVTVQGNKFTLINVQNADRGWYRCVSYAGALQACRQGCAENVRSGAE